MFIKGPVIRIAGLVTSKCEFLQLGSFWDALSNVEDCLYTKNWKYPYISFGKKLEEHDKENNTKYAMDPGIYYLLEADKDNTNSY